MILHNCARLPHRALRILSAPSLISSTSASKKTVRSSPLFSLLPFIISSAYRNIDQPLPFPENFRYMPSHTKTSCYRYALRSCHPFMRLPIIRFLFFFAIFSVYKKQPYVSTFCYFRLTYRATLFLLVCYSLSSYWDTNSIISGI